MTDALFFDLDGTLIDSEPGILGGIAHTLDALGHPPLSREALLPWIGPPLRDSYEALFNGDRGRAEQAVALYRAHYDAGGWREHSVYAGILELIGTLHATGRRLAVVTSKNEGFARRILESLPFGAAFETVVGASDDGTRRYKRELIAEALSRLDIEAAQATMIGDRLYDMQGARQHDMRAIGVLWGFGDADELREAGADVIVDSPAALLACVTGDTAFRESAGPSGPRSASGAGMLTSEASASLLREMREDGRWMREKLAQVPRMFPRAKTSGSGDGGASSR